MAVMLRRRVMLTKKQRDEIRRRANAATSPPWASEGESRWENVTATVDGTEGVRIAEVECTPDREFIAAAREDAPALLDALDEMERERDELRRALYDAALGVAPLPVV